MAEDGTPAYRPRRALPATDDDAFDPAADDTEPDDAEDVQPDVRPRRALVLLDPEETVQDQAPQPDGSPLHEATPRTGSAARTAPDASDGDPAARPDPPAPARPAAGPAASDDAASDDVAAASDDVAAASAPPPRAQQPAESAASTGRSRDRRSPRRRGVLIGAVAAALVVALGLGYSGWALLNGQDPVAAAERLASSPPSSPPLLPDRQMLDPHRAEALDAGGTWSIASDTRGVFDESAAATCLGDTLEDEPQAEATRIRTLTAGGDSAPAAFHQADEYGSAQQATEVMSVRAHALGGCATPRALLVAGWVGTNLGDQAVGVTVLLQPASGAAGKATYHTILLNRTGRIVNVLDVAAHGKPLAMTKVAKALDDITDSQCTAAVGLCATDASVSHAVPPLGDSVPGFPTLADIPQIDGSDATWTPGSPTRDPKITGTDCEGIDLASVEHATATQARTYILGDDPDAPFGFDTVIITLPSKKAADKLADTVSGNIERCAKRVLTAKVHQTSTFSGYGVKKTAIQGATYDVTQKVNKGKTTYRYRVGVASADNKVVYLFANPTKSEDFTTDQWRQLNLRAAQRATQIN